jgi:hypothetical protein
MRWRDPDAAPAGRVTAVEVFFDVVFVFTLTQLTRNAGGGSLPGRHRPDPPDVRCPLVHVRRLCVAHEPRAPTPGIAEAGPLRVTLYLAGIAYFRRCMSIYGLASTRFAAAFAVLMTIPIGALASARLHLASVLGIVVVMLLVSGRRTAAAARAIL